MGKYIRDVPPKPCPINKVWEEGREVEETIWMVLIYSPWVMGM